jgi:O-antigen/teichoic acid export membrane protein
MNAATRIPRRLAGGKRNMSVAGAAVRLAVSNLAIPASAVLTGPLLARSLGPAGRGALAAVLAPLQLVPMVITFGIPQALTYVVATGRASTSHTRRMAIAFGLFAGAISAVGVIALTPTLLHRYPAQRHLLVVLSLTLPIIMALGMLRYVAQGTGRYDLMTRERWFSVLVRLALIAVFAFAGALTVGAAAWFTHGVAVVATLLLLPAFGERGKTEKQDRQSEKALTRFVLRYGLATWIGTVGGVLVNRLDQVLLTPLAGARQLGYYAVAVSIAEVPLVALLAVRDVIFAASADRGDLSLVARASRATIMVSIPLCLAGIGLAPLLVPPIFGNDFGPSVPMTQVLFVATIPNAMSLVLTAGLFASGRPGLASGAQLVAAGVTVMALFLLVPKVGAIGAAYSSLAAYAVAACLVSVAVARVSNLSPRDFLLPRQSDLVHIVTRIRGRLSTSD